MSLRMPLACVTLALTLSLAAVGQEPKRTDRFGDPLPDGAVARLGTLRFRHGAPIKFIAPALGGKAILTVGGRMARLWDPHTGRQLWHCRCGEVLELRGRYGDGVRAAVSADGRRLAVAFDTGVRLWDLDARRELAPVSEEGGVVTSVALSPDGRTLASGTSGGTIRVWDLDDRTPRTLARNSGWVLALAFSPDSRRLAASNVEDSVRVWDLAAGDGPRRLGGVAKWSGPLAFSPDGKVVAAAGGGPMNRFTTTRERGPAVMLWDLASGRKRRDLGLWDAAATAVSFSPDGHRIAAAGLLNPPTVWDLSTGAEVVAARAAAETAAVAYMPDDDVLACGSDAGTLSLWDEGKATSPGPDAGPIVALALSSEEGLVAGCGGDATIRLWRLPAGLEERRLDAPVDRSFWTPSRLATFAPALAFANGGRVLVAAHDTWCAWGAPNGDRLWKRSLSAVPRVEVRAFAAEGSVCVTKERNRVIVLREPGGRSEWPLGAEGQTFLQSVSASPDGRTVAVVSRMLNGSPRAVFTLSLHEAAGGRELRRWGLELHAFAGPVFSPDGAWLAWVDGRGLRVASAATGRFLRTINFSGDPAAEASREQVGAAQVLDFSHDGRMIALGTDGGALVWEAATGLKRCELTHGHRGGVRCVAFAVGDRTLATGGNDSTVLLWDLTGTRAPLGGGPPPAPGLPSERLWVDLAETNGARARRAIWALAASPGEAAPFLGTKLSPVMPANPERLAALIANLDADSFETRARATAELEGMRESAAPGLRQALEQGGPETKRRAQELLEKLEGEGGPERWRELRAVEALEHMASPEATALLKSLAAGAPDARLTKEAKAALQRLDRGEPAL